MVADTAAAVVMVGSWRQVLLLLLTTGTVAVAMDRCVHVQASRAPSSIGIRRLTLTRRMLWLPVVIVRTRKRGRVGARSSRPL